MNWKSCGLAATAAMALACAAYAQPATFTDLGTLSTGTITSGGTMGGSAATNVKWFKFVVPTGVTSTSGWLDLDTSGGTPAWSNPDSLMGLYSNAGAVITTDDDDGTGAYSEITKGRTTPVRPISGGVGGNGRDGALAAGTYWLAVVPYNATFAANWTVTPTTNLTVSGGFALRVDYSDGLAPTNPTGAGTATPSSNGVGETTLLKVVVTPGSNPASTAHTVTANLTNIGGSATQTFYDDGSNGDVTPGDGTFSYLATVGAVPVGATTLPFVVQETAPLTRSSTGNISFSVVGPTNPTVALALSPSNGAIGSIFTATATVTNGAHPVSTGTTVTLNAAGINGGTVTLYDDGTHGDALAGNNVFTNNAVTVGAGTPNGTYTLTAQVSDAQGRSNTGNATFSVPYCTAGSTTADEYIYNVNVGTINSTTSPYPTGGYVNKTALSTDMVIGSTYALTVTNAPAPNNYIADTCGAWIDWNQNGSFTDAGEAITMANSPGYGNGPNGVPYTATISVPSGATLGHTTLRVRIAYNAAAAPCGSVTYGSTEDYTINVVAPTTPTNPSGTGTANPATNVPLGSSSLLTVAVTGGLNPPSTFLAVTADLTAIGGSASQSFYDDGTHGDVTSGDNTFSFLATVGGAAGNQSLPFTVSDAQSRSGTGSIAIGTYDSSTIWDETINGGSDTGDMPGTAQTVNRPSNIAQIRGNLSTTTDADMYVIHICSPTTFSASTVNGTTMDTQLFLFTMDGHGIVMNDDAPDLTVLQSSLSSAFTAALPAGDYLLAVSGYDKDPVDSASNPLFLDSEAACTHGGVYKCEHGPDDIGGANPLTSWDTGGGNSGAYTIFLTGVGGSSCAPATGSCCTANQCNITTQAACTGTWTAGGACTGPGSCNNGHFCGSADFNCDGDLGTDSDISAFFSCLSGDCPHLPCISNADFNGDGDIGTDSDIEAYFRVLSGGAC